MSAGPVKEITLAVGLSVEAFAVIGPTAQGGLYGSNTPELGPFASYGAGWWTNVGFGVGPVITLIFGPPTDLAGVAWGIGCDARFMTVPRNGTVLYAPENGALAVMAGGASVDFLTWDEYVAAGYESARTTRIPMRAIHGFPDRPAEGTVLRNPATGAIFMMRPETKDWFQTWERYLQLGFTAADFTNVPGRFLDTIPNGTSL